MPIWNKIAELSDQQAKAREAVFEAQMLAKLTARAPEPSLPTPIPTVPLRDAIQILVTESGQTSLYNPEAVPPAVQQRIMNAWHCPAPNTSPALAAAPARSRRAAMMLNLIMPGAGQFYLGQRAAGCAYAIPFIACLATLLVVFLRGYYQYLQLSTDGDILAAGNLEQLAHAFPTGLFAACSGVGTVIYLVSSIHLAVSRPRR